MRKSLLAGLVLFLALSLLPSCAPTVPKEDYDKVSSDLSASQEVTLSTQKELETAKTELESVKGDLKDADGQIVQLKANIQTTSDKLDAREKKIQSARLKVQLFNMLMLPGLQGQQLTQQQAATLLFEFQDKINSIGDPELTAKYKVFLQSAGTATMNPSMIDFFTYLLDSLEADLIIEQSY